MNSAHVSERRRSAPTEIYCYRFFFWNTPSTVSLIHVPPVRSSFLNGPAVQHCSEIHFEYTTRTCTPRISTPSCPYTYPAHRRRASKTPLSTHARPLPLPASRFTRRSPQRLPRAGSGPGGEHGCPPARSASFDARRRARGSVWFRLAQVAQKF